MHTQKVTLLDGAMGTVLQSAGLKLGERPETLSITAPQVVQMKWTWGRVSASKRSLPFTVPTLWIRP